MKKNLTLVIPVYNVESYIVDCINSICAQTYKCFNLILVNDGSTDLSIEIAKNILDKHKIEYYIIDKINKGLPSARNSGLVQSNSKWLISLDSDDVINPKFLEILVKEVEKNDVDIGFCDWNSVINSNKFNWNTKKNYKTVKYSQNKFQSLFLKRKIIPVIPTIIFKNELLIKNKLSLDENCLVGGDQQFIWKLSLYTNDVLHIKNKLYNYLKRDSSIMTKPNINKIIKSYNSMKKFESTYINNSQISSIKFIVPRWVFGISRLVSEYSNYESFKEMVSKCNVKENLKKLILFPDLKVIIYSIIFLLSSKFFYYINHRSKKGYKV